MESHCPRSCFLLLTVLYGTKHIHTRKKTKQNELLKSWKNRSLERRSAADAREKYGGYHITSAQRKDRLFVCTHAAYTMYYKHTCLFGKRSPTTVAMALDIRQQFLILFWRPSPLPQTNLVATRSSSHVCLVLLVSLSSSSSPLGPPGLPLCCDEIRTKL
jgi:hypothetical protein